jgi:hypothetical protein
MPLGHPFGAHTFRGYDMQQQYIPFDVSFTKNGRCSIDTYINTLHPKEHTDLYSTMEELVTQAIPLRNESLSSVQKDWRRLEFDEKVDSRPPMPKWKEDGHRCLCGLLPHFDSELSLNFPRGCESCESMFIPPSQVNFLKPLTAYRYLQGLD